MLNNSTHKLFSKSKAAALFIFLCLLFLVYIAWKHKFENLWRTDFLLGTIFFSYAIASAFLRLVKEKLIFSEKKVVAIYDAIWIVFAALGVISSGWFQAEKYLTSLIESDKQIIALQEEYMHKRSEHWLERVNSSLVKGEDDYTVLNDLKKLNLKSINIDDLKEYSPSTMHSKALSLSSNARSAIYWLDDEHDRLKSYRDTQSVNSQKKKQEGTPFWFTLFAPFLLAFGVGLRLVKATVDVRNAK